MGGRGLSDSKAVALLLGILGLVLFAGCGSSSAKDDPSSPTPAAAGRSPTAVRPSPTPSPTPDPLARRPDTLEQALAILKTYLPTVSDPCPPALVERWEAACYAGDLDGDGTPDAVYLVPLRGPAAAPLDGAAIIVRRAGRAELENFPLYGLADASLFGRYAFGIADRNGDALADITYLTNTCSARGCASRVEIQAWDGTAWREIGTAQPGIDRLEHLEITGEGTATTIAMQGGAFQAPGAGPTRSGIYHYAWSNGRYDLSGTEFDAPQYLIHAIQDADALLDVQGDLRGARNAYRAVIGNTALRDWKSEVDDLPPGAVSGRAQLEGYALFRIAVITAALGEDPTLDLDHTIAGSAEPLFANAAEAFRRGLRESGTVRAGCLEASRYLNTPPMPDYLRQLFDYGYANPAPSPQAICPF